MSLQVAKRKPAAIEELLFFRRWLAHPLKVGAVLPSSQRLGRLVARQVRLGADDIVVELGAGTGTVTRALLASGIPAERLFVVEIDPRLCTFLRRGIPSAQIVQGDARHLGELLPGRFVGRCSTVISGIPMLTLPLDLQRRMIDAWFGVLGPNGRLLQYTYSLVSPIPEAKHNLVGRRCGVAVRNVPPAWVWSYARVGNGPRAT
jgi:phosphatidylethanolamine/phosphatidyl-N-methylethanolamine N-methyltransferase